MKKNFPKALEPQIFISGHKNPDIDSLAAASALAVLRQRLGEGNYIPICPGVLNERAKYLYERFNITPPVCRNDVYIQVGDLISEVEAISGELSLFEAVSLLREKLKQTKNWLKVSFTRQLV